MELHQQKINLLSLLLGEYWVMNSEILKAQLKILRLKILNKNHDVIKYYKGRTYSALYTTQILKKKKERKNNSHLPISRCCWGCSPSWNTPRWWNTRWCRRSGEWSRRTPGFGVSCLWGLRYLVFIFNHKVLFLLGMTNIDFVGMVAANFLISPVKFRCPL